MPLGNCYCKKTPPFPDLSSPLAEVCRIFFDFLFFLLSPIMYYRFTLTTPRFQTIVFAPVVKDALVLPNNRSMKLAGYSYYNHHVGRIVYDFDTSLQVPDMEAEGLVKFNPHRYKKMASFAEWKSIFPMIGKQEITHVYFYKCACINCYKKEGKKFCKTKKFPVFTPRKNFPAFLYAQIFFALLQFLLYSNFFVSPKFFALLQFFVSPCFFRGDHRFYREGTW